MKKALLIFAVILMLTLCACAGKDFAKPPEESEPAAPTPEPSPEISFDTSALDEYMLTLTERSDLIKQELENGELNQYELNEKSAELAKLWLDAVEHLMGYLEEKLGSDDFEKLKAEQEQWIKTKDDAVKAAGEDFEGGSIYALIVSSEEAHLAEKRALELYAMFE